MSSVTTVFRKDKLNKKDMAPVHFRIIKDRKISYIASGIMLHKSEWDDNPGKINSKHVNYKRLNSFLTNKHAELQDQVFEHETITKAMSSRQLRDNLFGKKPTDFFEFADEVCKGYLSTGQVATHIRSKSIISKLKIYMNGQSLSFHDINVYFLTKYEAYLRNELHNMTNTVHKNLKFFRKLFNDAYRMDLIEHNANPFLKYRMKQEKTTRNYLSEEEIKSIIEFHATPGSKMEIHRDMFVFAAYAGGIRISDMLQMKWKNFDGTHLHFSIRKTSQQLSIKLPDVALGILYKYQQYKLTNECFIFPLLPEGLNFKDLVLVNREISGATAYTNKNLKYITKKCGINKNVTFHVSRHSWACMALQKGISIDKVSKLMGHASIRETQVYAKIINTELDKAMDVFN